MKQWKIHVILSVIMIIVILLYRLAFGLTNINDTYFFNNDNITLAWDYEFDNKTAIVNQFQVTYWPDDNMSKLKTLEVYGQVTQYRWLHFPLGVYLMYVTAKDIFGNMSDKSNIIRAWKQTIKPKNPTTMTIYNPNGVIRFYR